MLPQLTTLSDMEVTENDSDDSDDFAIINTSQSVLTNNPTNKQLSPNTIVDDFMHLSLPSMEHDDNKSISHDDGDDEFYIIDISSNPIIIEQNDNDKNKNKPNKLIDNSINNTTSSRSSRSPSSTPSSTIITETVADIISLTEPLIESPSISSIQSHHTSKTSSLSGLNDPYLNTIKPKRIKHRKYEYERYMADLQDDRTSNGCNSYLCCKDDNNNNYYSNECANSFFHQINIFNNFLQRYLERCFGADYDQLNQHKTNDKCK